MRKAVEGTNHFPPPRRKSEPCQQKRPLPGSFVQKRKKPKLQQLRLFSQDFLMKLLLHFGQVMLIFPFPRGTRSFCLQLGQEK